MSKLDILGRTMENKTRQEIVLEAGQKIYDTVPGRKFFTEAHIGFVVVGVKVDGNKNPIVGKAKTWSLAMASLAKQVVKE